MSSANLSWCETGQSAHVPSAPCGIAQKLSTGVSLLRRLAGLEWGAGAKTLRTAALSLIYSTAEYCAPAWCRSEHTRFIDSVLNGALRIVTGCLLPTPTDNFPVLSGIHTAELRHQRATLSFANCSSLDPGNILHGQLTELQAASKERLKFRPPFVPVAPRKLLYNLSELGIRAAQWTNLTWDPQYSKSMLALGVYIPRVSTRPIGISLTRTASVKLNRLRTGVVRFGSSMHKWGLVSSAKCECGASEQTAVHIILTCPIHRVPRGIMGLTVLDNETRCWLNSITANI